MKAMFPSQLKIPTFLAIAAATFALWILLAGLGEAGSSPCGSGCCVCHKRTTTLNFSCLDSEYQRHLDHGDPPTPCSATGTAQDGVAKAPR